METASIADHAFSLVVHHGTRGCWYCATPDSGCPVHRDGDG